MRCDGCQKKWERIAKEILGSGWDSPGSCWKCPWEEVSSCPFLRDSVVVHDSVATWRRTKQKSRGSETIVAKRNPWETRLVPWEKYPEYPWSCRKMVHNVRPLAWWISMIWNRKESVHCPWDLSIYECPLGRIENIHGMNLLSHAFFCGRYSLMFRRTETRRSLEFLVFVWWSSWGRDVNSGDDESGRMRSRESQRKSWCPEKTDCVLEMSW